MLPLCGFQVQCLEPSAYFRIEVGIAPKPTLRPGLDPEFNDRLCLRSHAALTPSRSVIEPQGQGLPPLQLADVHQVLRLDQPS